VCLETSDVNEQNVAQWSKESPPRTISDMKLIMPVWTNLNVWRERELLSLSSFIQNFLNIKHRYKTEWRDALLSISLWWTFDSNYIINFLFLIFTQFSFKVFLSLRHKNLVHLQNHKWGFHEWISCV
jgi:hypothetical protein